MTPTGPDHFSRKPIFDAIRRVLGRGFRQAEVDALDDALDASGDWGETGLETRSGASAGLSLQECVPSVPSCRKRRRTSAEGIALIKRFEGCARLRRDGLVEAYPDPGTGGAPWTIGWGATRDGLHGFVGRDTIWTQAQCDERLADDLALYEREVEAAIGKAPTTQRQFDALVSFHYNTGAIARATLTAKHRAGDFEAALAEFARWNRAGGKVLKGLVRRRAAEASHYAGAQ